MNKKTFEERFKNKALAVSAHIRGIDYEVICNYLHELRMKLPEERVLKLGASDLAAIVLAMHEVAELARFYAQPS